ncbi:MAG: T9SS type A sorting domain-containing protein [Candidatus Cloacimonetes bacterium]|nr:T9SS type A sorting domain-containing protein [Candidatus Cloacimonadota bacterium]
MKKIIIFLILFGFSVSLCFAQTVNGDTLTVDGKKILKIWGTHYERGYATGYLVGDKIKYIMEDYFIPTYFMNNSVLYENCRMYYLNNFDVEDKYHSEAQGIIDGMIEAGLDLFSVVLQRDMDSNDVLMVNALVDLVVLIENGEFGCSSISSWGPSTYQDPDLNGAPVITRNMDWTPHPALLENHLLVIHFPSEDNEVNWLSFTFPGFIGGLSALNEDGLSAFMNMGNVNSYPNTEIFHPILFSIRNAIETYDYNGDMNVDPLDVRNAIEDKYQISGSIVHCINNSEALVIECNNESGVEARDDTDNTIIPFNNLAATNHFRKLYPPDYCYRYENISDSLIVNSEITIERSWNLLAGAAGVSSTLHTIQYAPTLNMVKWSTATSGIPAYQNVPTVFDLEELFTLNTSADTEYFKEISLVNTFPNPFYSSASLSFSLPEATNVEIIIFNIKGQKIRKLINEACSYGNHSFMWDGKDDAGNNVVSGIYFYRFETEYKSESGRLILIK